MTKTEQAAARLAKRADEMAEAWRNGNRNSVDAWIGNSARRLLAIYTAFAVAEGTHGARLFMDGIRNKRDA